MFCAWTRTSMIDRLVLVLAPCADVHRRGPRRAAVARPPPQTQGSVAHPFVPAHPDLRELCGHRIAANRLGLGRDLVQHVGLVSVGHLVNSVPGIQPVRPSPPSEPRRVGAAGPSSPGVSALHRAQPAQPERLKDMRGPGANNGPERLLRSVCCQNSLRVCTERWTAGAV